MTTVVLELSLIEAAHLTDLVEQFAALVGDGSHADPAVARLTPDAYTDDDDAAREFRELTESDLLARRQVDAEVVLDSLRPGGDRLSPDDIDPALAAATVAVVLDPGQTGAWLRTLAALRLVLASRLGIEHESDQEVDDPRFGVYEWLGYRLDGLVRAVDG
ncbi:DUF2017 family protein [Microbacterium sp.]|uniref:DUF2017 family protein n=1 Tax=Microbacterium sp. TaxID=51671 RepID=UPI0039E3968E